MKIKWDKTADALYIELSSGTVAESEPVADGIVLDFNPHGDVIGIEVLQVSTRSSTIDLTEILLQTA